MKKYFSISAALLVCVCLTGCEPAATPPTTPSAYKGEFNPKSLEVGPEVGQLAPEIAGVDLDGVPFKLSDYRGKVVMLDFYGDW